MLTSALEVTDTATLAPGLVIRGQSIGVASRAQGFDGVDGILGIGPVDLTQGTVSNTDLVPTVTDNLFAQGLISSNSIGISYEPSTGNNEINGELNFGGVDTTKYVSPPCYQGRSQSLITCTLLGLREISTLCQSLPPLPRPPIGASTRPLLTAIVPPSSILPRASLIRVQLCCCLQPMHSRHTKGLQEANWIGKDPLIFSITSLTQLHVEIGRQASSRSLSSSSRTYNLCSLK